MSDKIGLDEAAFFDKAATIYLLTRLNRSYTKWDAYKRGIIDDKGNIIKQPETRDDRRAFGAFDKLILKIRKVLPNSALRVLSAISIYKLIVEDEKMVENVKFKNDTMIYLFEKMILEAEDRGLDRNEVMEWMNDIIEDF